MNNFTCNKLTTNMTCWLGNYLNLQQMFQQICPGNLEKLYLSKT